MSDLINTALSEHADGAALSIIVTPRASRTELDRVEAGVVRLRVAAPPVDGAANSAVLRFLADALALPRSRVRLLSGETSRRKRVLLVGVSTAEIAGRLRMLLVNETSASR